MSNPIVIIDLAHHGLEPADTYDGLIAQERQAAKGSRSPKYRELAKAMVATVKSVVGRQASLKTVTERLGNPVQEASGTMQGVWVYDIPDGEDLFEFGTVLHACVLAAQDLDLVVLADHLGVAFLPGQRLLKGLNTSTQWELLFEGSPEDGEDPEATSRPQMIKRVLKMMGEKLKPHGFALSKEKWVGDEGVWRDQYYFVRERSEGRQWVSVLMSSDGYHGLDLKIWGGAEQVPEPNFKRRAGIGFEGRSAQPWVER